MNKCPNCDNSISEYEPICPSCGYVISKSAIVKIYIFCYVMVAFSLCATITGFFVIGWIEFFSFVSSAVGFLQAKRIYKKEKGIIPAFIICLILSIFSLIGMVMFCVNL